MLYTSHPSASLPDVRRPSMARLFVLTDVSKDRRFGKAELLNALKPFVRQFAGEERRRAIYRVPMDVHGQRLPAV